MKVYTIEIYWGDEWEGGWRLLKVTADEDEARGYEFDEDYSVTEWEVDE